MSRSSSPNDKRIFIAIATNFNPELNVQKVGCNIICKKRDLSSTVCPTESGISLIILTPMKILQRNLNSSTFVV